MYLSQMKFMICCNNVFTPVTYAHAITTSLSCTMHNSCIVLADEYHYHSLSLENLNYDLCESCYQSIDVEQKPLFLPSKTNPWTQYAKVCVGYLLPYFYLQLEFFYCVLEFCFGFCVYVFALYLCV